ncbi:hypothetical protein COT75_00345 [Candidatus Beckwithbacteria bacterium CG10_big_fil_rev_8_21_14_0_10_34_10]|uniref:Solute-binding protein family 5 domain-containing protein n=1 Tax=Candidatus Beckwithbacteria bacterium CG10_big_fil_rev_8_21_14_0_10_34_10 TaxID=1974495 RepID=A0A2H0WCK6_9BACT|nr:MAG: hypothetical protein COT75_00345 [Candidatus Beckwithbacteria bacterium CG10_big_fil_rev_8_21_14_0_10_34_10]
MKFFKRFRLFSWVTKAFLAKHGRTIIVASLIGIIGFFFIGKIMPLLPRLKKHEKVGKIGRLDLDNLPLEITRLLSLGLTTVSTDGSAAPGLAKEWQISGDGLVYTFTLLDNIYWQDETPATAWDINYNFSDVQVNVLSDKQIRFTLKEPFSPFLIILNQPVFKENYLGVGPYKIKRIKKSANLVEKITLTSPEKDISFRYYPTEEAALVAFKMGEIDVLDRLIKPQLDEKWLSKVNLEEKIVLDQYLGLFFNTEDQIFSEKSYRQALAYAIEDKTYGDRRATGPISPISWAYNPDAKLYDYNPAKAKELFDLDEKVKIKISTTEPFLDQAEKIKRSWEEVLNVEVEIALINSLSEEFQIFLGIQEIPSDPDQYVFWHSTRNTNITKFKSPKIDKLLEDGRTITSKEERLEKYLDFQRFISEESPVIFLSHPKTYRLSRKRLSFF